MSEGGVRVSDVRECLSMSERRSVLVRVRKYVRE